MIEGPPSDRPASVPSAAGQLYAEDEELLADDEPHDNTMLERDLPTLRPPPAAALPQDGDTDLDRLVDQLPTLRPPPFIEE
jgi:hypothetical protein